MKRSKSKWNWNSKITDKLLQKAIEGTQNLRREVRKDKDVISVADLKSTKPNELKSIMEIQNL